MDGVMMPLFLGKADGTIAVDFESETVFKKIKPLRLKSLRTSEKKFKKTIVMTSRQKFKKGTMIVTVTAKWGDIEISEQKRLPLP